MVVEYIRYRVGQDRADAFLAAYARAAGVLEHDGRCLSYELTRGQEEPDRYVVRIEWTSVDDHLQGFRRSPQFASFFAAVKPYVRDIEEMSHYQTQAVFRRESGSEQPATEVAAAAPVPPLRAAAATPYDH